MSTSRPRATEIDIIRSLIIIALILVHSTAPFTGGWTAIADTSPWWANVYKWIGHVTYAGMLETFVAISGYVYCIANTHRQQSFQSLCTSKLKRLMLPAIVWGTVYWWLFSAESLSDGGAWHIINGIGHLWFLPMLFWCFILEKAVVLPYKVPIYALAIVAILPYPALPFHLNDSLYYLLFFHIGYKIYQKKKEIISAIDARGYRTGLSMFCIATACMALMAVSTSFRDSLELPSYPMLEKRLLICLLTTLRAIYSAGIMTVYFAIGFSLRNTSTQRLVQFIAECSFGIYLLQEFIIRLVYYKFPFCEAPYLPIAGFICGLFISLIIVIFGRKVPVINRLL